MRQVILEVNDPVVEMVAQEMASRDRKGFAKYGTTTMDNPLTLKQWLQHALEETLDKAVYLKRAILKIEEEEKHPPIHADLDIYIQSEHEKQQ